MNYEATIRRFFEGKPGYYGAWMAAGVLLLLILGISYQTVLLLIETPNSASAVSLENAEVSLLSVEETENKRFHELLQALPNLHLFGKATEAPSSSLQQTPLKLILQGIMHGSDPQHSAAIIGEEGSSAKAYHRGDSLPRGVTLEEILSHSVILRREGVREELSLPRRELPASQPSTPLFGG